MTDAIPNRVECELPAFQGTYACDSCQRAGRCLGTREVDATRNRVPTEAELAEVMAACWDNPGFRSNREANGYPKMAKALRAYLLERVTILPSIPPRPDRGSCRHPIEQAGPVQEDAR